MAEATRVPGAPPNPPEDLGDDIVIGGSPEDRAQLRELYLTFLDANDHIDFQKLQTIWSYGPDKWYFNTNGYNYYGLEDWEHIWDYYRPQFAVVKPFTPGRRLTHISGDLALLAGEYLGRYKEWAGGDGGGAIATQTRELATLMHHRLTMVCLRSEGQWRVIHFHSSEQALGPRPDQADVR